MVATTAAVNANLGLDLAPRHITKYAVITMATAPITVSRGGSSAMFHTERGFASCPNEDPRDSKVLVRIVAIPLAAAPMGHMTRAIRRLGAIKANRGEPGRSPVWR